eukprot:4961706-Amphidinium_carterae.1
MESRRRHVWLDLVRPDLQYRSENLRGDRKVVLEAVQKCARNLQFASEALRADREVVLARRPSGAIAT